MFIVKSVYQKKRFYLFVFFVFLYTFICKNIKTFNVLVTACNFFEASRFP